MTDSKPHKESHVERELRLALILLGNIARDDEHASARAMGFLAGVRERLSSVESEVGAVDIAYFWLRGAQLLGMLHDDGDWDRLIALLDAERTIRPEVPA